MQDDLIPVLRHFLEIFQSEQFVIDDEGGIFPQYRVGISGRRHPSGQRLFRALR